MLDIEDSIHVTSPTRLRHQESLMTTHYLASLALKIFLEESSIEGWSRCWQWCQLSWVRCCRDIEGPEDHSKRYNWVISVLHERWACERIDGNIIPALWEFKCIYSHSYLSLFLWCTVRVLIRASQGIWDRWVQEKRRKYGIRESDESWGGMQAWGKTWESISSNSHPNANLSSLSCPILHVLNWSCQ